jgi:hypothetical protein
VIVGLVAAEAGSKAIASEAVEGAVEADQSQRVAVGPRQAISIAHRIFTQVVSQGTGAAVAEGGAGCASKGALGSHGVCTLEVAVYGDAPFGSTVESTEIGCGVTTQAAAVAEAGIAVEGAAQAAATGGVGIVAGRTL